MMRSKSASVAARRRSLSSDDSGALLVVGIVMGAILVGVLWHVASIGDAIVWRETAQDAADSAAFENAVWNARGMNLLSLLNILMAAIMAVLVIWRLTIMLIYTVAAVLAIACVAGLFVPGLVAACSAIPNMTPVLRVAERMQRFDRKLADNVTRFTRVMGTTQKVVAGAIPPMGAIAAMDDTNDAFADTDVYTVSASLMPNLESATQGQFLGEGAQGAGMECEAKSDSEKQREKQQGHPYTARDFINTRVGFVFSLPVQEERWAVLCQKAGEFVPNNIAGLLERAGAPSGFVGSFDTLKSIIGPLTGTFPTAFCASDPLALMAATEDLTKATHQRTCDAKRAALPEAERKKFDMKDCLDQSRKKTAEKHKIPNVGNYKQTCSRPVKVWDYAQNGNLAMQSFSFVDKQAAHLARDDRGLEVGDGTRAGNVRNVEPDWIRAQAEMYFDCTTAWEACRGNATWALNWRARLRRVQNLRKMGEQMGSRLVIESLVSGLYRVAGKATKRYASSRGIPDIIQENFRDTWATAKVRDFVRGKTYQGWSLASRIVRNPPTGSVIIH